MISEQEVVNFCEIIRNTEFDFQPSFFEITFVMAIRHFRSQDCDYVVLETGMGGRLDATNVVTPLVSVITNIGLDHQQYLGNTIREIAKEKAGIIKDDTPLVLGRKQDGIHSVFEEIALQKRAPLVIAKKRHEDPKLPVYQLENIDTAVSTLEILNVDCKQENIQKGLNKLIPNTGYAKRMEIIHQNPTIILDVSHNKEGLTASIKEVKKKTIGQVYCILASTKERLVDVEFIDIFKDVKLHFCTFFNERSKSKEEWNAINSSLNKSIPIHTSVNKLYTEITAQLSPHDTLIVTGSFFLLADLNLQSNN